MLRNPKIDQVAAISERVSYPRKLDNDISYDLPSTGLQERGDQTISKRWNRDAGLKVRVVLEAVKVEQTVSELCAECSVLPTLIHQRKKALFDGASDLFECGGKKKAGKSVDSRCRARGDVQRRG